MLFNSYVFLFAFLPLVVSVFFLLGRWSAGWAAGWLASASIAFYSWWDIKFTHILFSSILFNFLVAKGIYECLGSGRTRAARGLAGFGIGADLLALGYFKYAGFFASIAGATWTAAALPIGISFFTFTQIAFLADTLAGKVENGGTEQVRPVHYLLFVTYFPHLIAGPILHHAEMMPQFRRPMAYRPSAEALCVGMTVFVIGLCKKLVVADHLAVYADTAFAPGAMLTLPGAWRGVLAYTLQIYFDFSAYCDMAIGVSRMLNITLPANFESPYRACSISDFWRRWHMTLSRFLRDYLYIPLGGNRCGRVRRHVNLMATMVLCGLWHGAGWSFLIWGFLHGGYLCAHHAWRAGLGRRVRLPSLLGWVLTFGAVMIAWVFFRAPDLPGALRLLRLMAGLGEGGEFRGASSGGLGPFVRWIVGERDQVLWLLAGLGGALFLPNLRQVMGRHELVLASAPSLDGGLWLRIQLLWAPNLAWAVVVVGVFLISLARLNQVSQFLYFQF